VDRDVLAQSGIAWLIVFEASTISAPPTRHGRATTGDDRTDHAFQQIITAPTRKESGSTGATITPFGGNTAYDDPAGIRESARQTVNTGFAPATDSTR